MDLDELVFHPWTVQGPRDVPTFVRGSGSHVSMATAAATWTSSSQLVFTNLGHQHRASSRRRRVSAPPCNLDRRLQVSNGTRLAPPQTLTVFGASGDLARRKLLPSLHDLAYEGLLPELRDRRLGRKPAGGRWLPASARGGRSRSSPATGSMRALAGVRRRALLSAPLDDPEAFGPLRDHLVAIDAELGAEGRRLFYCGTPPRPSRRSCAASATPTSRERADRAREADRARHGERRRARPHRARGLRRPQVFRIDHYLGKEAVQNILVFRFANSMVERAWCGEAVDHVQITVTESAGIERRGRYYEEAGALRDMVQNHLLQVLAFVAMERPTRSPQDVRDRKAELLEAVVRPLSEDELVGVST